MPGLNQFGFRPKEDPRPVDEPWPEATWPIPDGAELRGSVATLRPIQPADHAELQHALDSPKVWLHLPTPRPQTPEDLSVIVASVQARGFFPWVLRLSEDLDTEFGALPAGAVVGWSSYLEVAPKDARLEIGNTAYTPAVWGTAVNPEAKLLLLGYAFEGLGMGRVQLKTDVRNLRSQRAIAGLGATYEGTLRRYQRRADGTMRDTVLFSITAEDWPAVRRALEARVGASGL
jgi:RimJ/RimL family protein N-acetyltransferase